MGSFIAEESGLDPDLVSACGPAVLAEQYDHAVASAFKVLEGRMRELLGMKGGTGTQMSERAFGAQGGLLAAGLKLDRDQAEATKALFVAAFKLYRNPIAHEHQGHSAGEARQIIGLVDLLLSILAKAETEALPEQPILRQIRDRIGAAAYLRLDRFLDQAAAMGIKAHPTRGYLTYKARLQWTSPRTGAEKPHAVGVFYLWFIQEDPFFGPALSQLKHVNGLDLPSMEAALLAAGCEHYPDNDTPVRLPLAEINDQETFRSVLRIIDEHLGPSRA